jgi:septal ring factor EnvC (AmiA/AmiB activator)
MNQLTNKFNRTSAKPQSIEQLEAEYQKNQQRIRQIDRRNQELAEQIRSLQQTPPSHNTASVATARKPKSLLRRAKNLRRSLQGRQWGKYSLEFWLQVTVLGLGIALVCGMLSFMVTRLIAALLGG